MPSPTVSTVEVRPAVDDDAPFLVEMSRFASTLDDRPLPNPDDPGVRSLLPDSMDHAFVAMFGRRRVGAAWWRLNEPPLLRGNAGEPLPELAVAVVPDARRQGVGTALVETLASRLAEAYEQVSLNVHLVNPATRLYIGTGFRVAGHGRGVYGVSMVRDL
jgi:GNAT superfamily N-acetyltransferase